MAYGFGGLLIITIGIIIRYTPNPILIIKAPTLLVLCLIVGV